MTSFNNGLKVNVIKGASAETITSAVASCLASKSIAIEKANEASVSANSAESIASVATTQASIATAQASIATTQATIATTKANESAGSASSALISKTNAATSEANALSYKNSASTSATIATTKANEALGYRDAALTYQYGAESAYSSTLSLVNNLELPSVTHTVDTVDDFGTVPNGIDTVIVKDLNRGGTFIYDATQSAVNNGGTIFDGWVRQYSGAIDVKWFGMEGDDVTYDVKQYDLNIEQKNKEFVKNGNAKHISKNQSNILEKYSLYGTEVYKTGKLNFGNPLQLDTSKTYRICILGDSIAVGSDFSSYRTMPGETRDTGQMLDSSMGLYSDYMVQLFLAKGIKFDLYNRSIGGCALSDLPNVLSSLPHEFSGREFVDTSKTWYQNVADIEPDILILSHGMNHTSTSHYLDALEGNLYQPATTSGWLKDLVIMTTPNPNWLQTDAFGDFKEYNLNGHKMIMQMQQRAWARNHNCYVIDVGNLQSIYRYGISTVEKSAYNQDGYYISKNGVGQGNGTSNAITFTNGQYAQYESDNISAEGQIVFNVSVDSTFLGTNTNLLSFYPTLNTSVQLYPDRIGIGNGTKDGAIGYGAIGEFTTFTLPSSFQLKLDYTEYALRVYIDNVCVAKMSNLYIGNFLNQIVHSGTGTSTITPLKKYSVWYPKYKNVMSGDDMWSFGTGGSTWGVLPWGGGVNHPNIKGLTAVYLPCITEFINDINMRDDILSYYDMTSSRTGVSLYVNDTSHDIEVIITLISSDAVCEAILYTIENTEIFRLAHYRTGNADSDIFTLRGMVKSGSTYGLTGLTAATIQYWTERK